MVWTNKIFRIYWHKTSYPASCEEHGTGQYPVWITQKPRKGDFGGVKIQTISQGSVPWDPPRSLCLCRSLTCRKSSVFILDPSGSAQGILTENCKWSFKCVVTMRKAFGFVCFVFNSKFHVRIEIWMSSVFLWSVLFMYSVQCNTSQVFL